MKANMLGSLASRELINNTIHIIVMNKRITVKKNGSETVRQRYSIARQFVCICVYWCAVHYVLHWNTTANWDGEAATLNDGFWWDRRCFLSLWFVHAIQTHTNTNKQNKHCTKQYNLVFWTVCETEVLSSGCASTYIYFHIHLCTIVVNWFLG